jgi:hypothetical protein
MPPVSLAKASPTGKTEKIKKEEAGTRFAMFAN